MLRRPSPSNRRNLPTRFLIYTLKIRNRRNPRRISNLHFSNLYKSPALFLSDYASDPSPSAPPQSPGRGSSGGRGFSPGVPPSGSTGVLTPEAKRARSLPPRFLASSRPPIRTPLIYGSGIESRMRRASLSRASIASRGIPPTPMREPRAKLQRTLIYGNGINFSRKLLKTKDRSHA